MKACGPILNSRGSSVREKVSSSLSQCAIATIPIKNGAEDVLGLVPEMNDNLADARRQRTRSSASLPFKFGVKRDAVFHVHLPSANPHLLLPHQAMNTPRKGHWGGASRWDPVADLAFHDRSNHPRRASGLGFPSLSKEGSVAAWSCRSTSRDRLRGSLDRLPVSMPLQPGSWCAWEHLPVGTRK